MLIPDKFKGSLTAHAVIESVSKGILRADPRAGIWSVLASDGGEGFLDAVSNNIPLKEIITDTVDPIGRPIRAPYLLDTKTNTAYIELAKASGLVCLSEKERNVMQTSTYGTGLQIKDAIANGAKAVYIGLGGSATNDGGIGIAKALGYTFLDANGEALPTTGNKLSEIFKIKKRDGPKAVKDVSFFAVNDVDNPLFGARGAAYVYAGQKGANEKEIGALDAGLRHLNQLAGEQLSENNAFLPGAGAAGGTAYGLKTFFGAEYISGITFLLQLAEVPKLLQKHRMDYIITGEGKIDGQTINGKLVKGIIRLGQKFNVPVVAVCGKLDIGHKELHELGLQNVMETYDAHKGLEHSMKNASKLIEDLMFDFFSNKIV